MNKLVAFSGLLSLFILLTCSSSVYAATINFQQCANNIDHHCMVYLPQQNTGPQVNPNWHVTIILPDNTAPQIDQIISDTNYTALKNDVAVMWVGNIYTTTVSPTMNFCPISLATLVGQDGYLYKFYNTTDHLDLTPSIYPVYCHAETGPNPISGDATVPEFSLVAAVFAFVIGIVIVLGRMVDGHWTWQFGKI